MSMEHRERDPAPQPGVVFWFKVYCGLLCLVYAAVPVLLCGVYLLMDPAEIDADPAEFLGMVVLLSVVSVGMLVVFFVPLVLSPRPWVWTYDMVMICIGMTSCLTLPFSIALVINWVKPETKAYFGRD